MSLRTRARRSCGGRKGAPSLPLLLLLPPRPPLLALPPVPLLLLPPRFPLSLLPPARPPRIHSAQLCSSSTVQSLPGMALHQRFSQSRELERKESKDTDDEDFRGTPATVCVCVWYISGPERVRCSLCLKLPGVKCPLSFPIPYGGSGVRYSHTPYFLSWVVCLARYSSRSSTVI